MNPLDSQPGGRAGAPGELALVQAFVNTYDIEGREDELPDAAALRRFLAGHGLLGRHARVGDGDHRHALRLREAFRAFAASNNGEPLPPSALAQLNETAQRSKLIAAFSPSGEPREAPAATGIDRALGELLAIVHRAIREGTWSRLKACHEHGCRWVFYDQSRNRSGTWCSMAVCGTHTKMRRYRARALPAREARTE